MTNDAQDPENGRKPVERNADADAGHEEEGDEEQVVTLNADSASSVKEEFAEDREDPREVERRKRAAEQEKAMRRPNNAREVLTQFVPNRSERAEEKLRSHLVGKIAIEVDGPNESYLFEWTSGRAAVREERATGTECSIRLSEQNLMRVVAGDLNPQVAMLSGKIQVQGNAEAAVYFFNLVAPRANH